MEEANDKALRKDSVTQLTKILIHKAHGNRKMDSKFWRDDIYIDNKKEYEPVDVKIERKINKRFKKTSIYVYLIGTILCVLVASIFARPEWFPFLDYHNIYKGFSRLVTKTDKPSFKPNKTTIFSSQSAEPQKIINQSLPATAPIKQGSTFIQPANTAQNSSINLRGKVFSWYDKDGHRHFSNTNYPANNPTLTFKDEIKGEVPVTKIRVINGQVYLPATFHNKGRELTLWMALDTGCTTTNLNFSQLNKLGANYQGTSTSILADGSRIKNRTTHVDWIKVGPIYEYNVKINGANIAGSQNKGLLGLNFLKKHPFKIDFQNEFIAWER